MNWSQLSSMHKGKLKRNLHLHQSPPFFQATSISSNLISLKEGTMVTLSGILYVSVTCSLIWQA